MYVQLHSLTITRDLVVVAIFIKIYNLLIDIPREEIMYGTFYFILSGTLA